MKYLQRSCCALILLALVTSLSPLLAQSENVKGAGSGVVLPLVEQLATTGDTGVTLALNTTGTAAGFDALCSGEVALTGATRTISVEEETACRSNGVTYMELLVAHHILAFIGNPSDDFLTCMNTTELDTLFTPASAGRVTTWMQVKANYPELAVKVLVPESGTLAYEELDRLVRGDGIRSDAIPGDTTTIIQMVTAEPGAIGVIDWQSAQTAAGSVKIINLNTSTSGTCTSPDASAVETGSYTAADRLYLYVNAAQAAALQPLLDFIVSDPAQTIVLNAGFSPVSFVAQESNRRVVSGEVTGRVFSREEVEFQVPANLAGTVNVAGSGALFDYLKGIADGMTGGGNQQVQQSQANLAINFKMEGETAGIRRLCNGEVDIVVSTASMTDEQTAACQANNIETVTVSLGAQVVVLVGHEGDTVTECLTRDQLIKIWGAPSNGLENWKDVGEGLPDLPMTLFGLNAGSPLSDIMLSAPGSAVLPVRQDTELNQDALYRAAAVANVEGALTYMSWAEYVRVLENNQTRIQVVAIDGGNGCVEPSIATITDGSYPLLETTQLIISQKALARIEVQSYVWSLFLDANFSNLAAQGIIGIDVSRLSDVRVSLQAEFDKAVAAAEAAAEATPEATPETGAEATAEATTDVEPAATADATEESAPEPTAEPTDEAAPAETIEAAPEPAAEATSEPTAEATPEPTAEAGS
jgi:phosphate transport system substrate-binding protein